MPKATVAGHPLHPMLIVVPAGLLPFSSVLDLIYMKTGEKSYADAAYYSMVGGFLGGLIAGAAGAADYFTIPPKSDVKKTANLHAVLNIGLLGLTSVNLLLRRGDSRPKGGLPLLLSLVGTCGVVVSSWYGGHMVYSQGMRVKGVSPVAGAPEIKPPGDEMIEQAFTKLEEVAAPAEGYR